MHKVSVVASIMLAGVLTAQAPQVSLNLPAGPVTRLTSPDGKATLYGVPYGANTPPQLWFENMRSHERTKLLDVPSTLSAAWSANGKAFLVLDHEASDKATSYIYDAATLQRLDLAARITASDPAARPYTHDHTYFDAERWQGNNQVLVRLHGHTDTPPVTCFDFRYRVSRGGVVTKLSQRILPVGGLGC